MKKTKETVIYMMLSSDEYELPEAVADSPTELARITGTTRTNILSSISHGYKRFVKVVLEEEV